MGKIQTGVDKLINLLHEKHKVTVEEAAKALGVSKIVVQEWADFLGEEGLLEIKYSLSKTYLLERMLSKNEFEQKEKQFENQRETFIRRVDTAVAQLDTETVSFEKFRKEFEDVKKDLGTDLEDIQKDLNELKQYEALKQEVTNDLHKQHAVFAKKQEETDASLQREYKQYQDVLHAISEQEKRLSTEKRRVQETILSEQTIGKKLEEYEKLLVVLKDHITEETEQLGVDEGTLEKLRKKAAQCREELTDIEENNLKPLQKIKTENEEKVKKIEEKILQKASAISAAAKKPQQLGNTVKQKLEKFFTKKKDIEVLLVAIEKDKIDLHAELKDLEQRAQAYRLGKTAVRIEELESKLNTVEERKKTLKTHIAKFLKLLQ